MTINGAWFVGFVQPILVSFGAVFTALNSDLEPMLDIKPIEMKKWFSSNDEPTVKGMENMVDDYEDSLAEVPLDKAKEDGEEVPGPKVVDDIELVDEVTG